jgi:hypothetical protein
MTNKNIALSSSPDCTPLYKAPVSGSLAPGMRFFRNGHWWEIDGHIKGRANSYYRCKPVCCIESRFYTESEIKQALEEETQTMHQKKQEYANRGTGRILIEPVKNTSGTIEAFNNRLPISSINRDDLDKKDSLKVLLIGSRHAVKKAIQTLHLSAFASSYDWSAFQKRSDSNEIMSILVQKI